VGAGKGAAAEAGSTDSAGGLIVGESDEGAVGFFVDGHFRDLGDAHADTHHTEEAAELAAFEDDLGMETSAITGGDGGIAETMAIAKGKEGLRAQVLERERMLAGADPNDPAIARGAKRRCERIGKVSNSWPRMEGENGEVDRGGPEALEEDERDFLDNGDFEKAADEVGEDRARRCE